MEIVNYKYLKLTGGVTLFIYLYIIACLFIHYFLTAGSILLSPLLLWYGKLPHWGTNKGVYYLFSVISWCHNKPGHV